MLRESSGAELFIDCADNALAQIDIKNRKGMDTMKKSIALFLVFALVFALCACGQPQVIEKEVEKTVEVPVVPEAW